MEHTEIHCSSSPLPVKKEFQSTQFTTSNENFFSSKPGTLFMDKTHKRDNFQHELKKNVLLFSSFYQNRSSFGQNMKQFTSFNQDEKRNVPLFNSFYQNRCLEQNVTPFTAFNPYQNLDNMLLMKNAQLINYLYAEWMMTNVWSQEKTSLI